MRPTYSLSTTIAVALECGDLDGWCDEHEARMLVKAGRATVQSAKGSRIRRIILTAREDLPLVGRDRQRALAGYIGAAKYTYREELASGNLITLKRALPSGQFVRWPG